MDLENDKYYSTIKSFRPTYLARFRDDEAPSFFCNSFVLSFSFASRILFATPVLWFEGHY